MLVHNLEPKVWQQRIETINDIGVLERNSDDTFSNTCLLASSICRTNQSFLCVLSENKQTYLAYHGHKIEDSQLPPQFVLCETTLASDTGFFIHHIHSNNGLPNDHPFINSGYGFYAGFRICAPNGTPIATLCTLHNQPHQLDDTQISQMKLLAKTVEEKLVLMDQINKQKESIDELYDLYENAPCGYHSLNSDGKIVKINKTELEWLGCHESDILGKHVTHIFHESEKEKVEDTLMLVKKYGYITQSIFKLKVKNGETKQVLLSATAIKNKRGKFLRTRSTLHDISLRMEYEEMLKEKNKELEATNSVLNQLNSEKNQFFGMAVHDLKNPISAISSLVKLIELENPDLNPQLKEYLNHIYSSANKVMTLVKSLLDINRIEQTGMKPHMTNINIKQMLERCVDSYTSHLEQKSIAIEFQSVDNTLEISTDLIFLQQITDNLVSNAIKFSPPNKKIYLNAYMEDSTFVFSVKDEGPGIKKEEANRLFTKFSRLSNRPTGGETSSGLGLAIVKDFSERLGGSVVCESEEGQGATFTVRLPQ